MKGNVFDRLAEIEKILPKEVEKAVREATEESVNKYGDRMYNALRATCGGTLRKHMNEPEKGWDKEDKDKYVYITDWDNETIVNKDQKKAFGQKENVKRKKGKRNYSLRPATYHDLAWILNYGHAVPKKDGTVTIIPPNYFISIAVKKKNGWKKEQTKIFKIKLTDIAKYLE